MLSILKVVGVPGSIAFFLLCCGIATAVALLWPRRARLARRFVLFLSLIYLVMALPRVAVAIADALPPVHAGAKPSEGAITRLVVFDGDNPYGRIREAERIYARDAPADVWALGKRWFADELIARGIPADHLRLDERPPTTRDQIVRLEQLRAERPRDRIGVIASRLQCPRVDALLRSTGLDALLICSSIDPELPASGVRLFIPTYGALRASRDAIYEHAALAYYRRRGWM